jgi:D-3-phosphoglycerate dehydrogenase
MPSVSAEEAPILKPFIALAEQLGSFAGQITESAIRKVEIVFDGKVSQMNIRPLTSAALAGLLRPLLSDINMVSAPIVMKERGVQLTETKQDQTGVFESYIKITLVTEKQTRSVAGTIFNDGRPRIIQIKGINMEAELCPHMLLTSNTDKPGYIGKLGNLMGEEGINIASFNLGRADTGGDAIALLGVDTPIDDAVLSKVTQLDLVTQAKALSFPQISG